MAIVVAVVTHSEKRNALQDGIPFEDAPNGRAAWRPEDRIARRQNKVFATEPRSGCRSSEQIATRYRSPCRGRIQSRTKQYRRDHHQDATRERIEAGGNEAAEDDDSCGSPGGKFEKGTPEEYIHHARPPDRRATIRLKQIPLACGSSHWKTQYMFDRPVARNIGRLWPSGTMRNMYWKIA